VSKRKQAKAARLMRATNRGTSVRRNDSSDQADTGANKEVSSVNAQLPRENSDPQLPSLAEELCTVSTPSDVATDALWEVGWAAGAIINTVREPLLLLDASLRVQGGNAAFYQTFQVAREETQDRLLFELGNHQWDIPRLRTLLEERLPQNRRISDFDVEGEFQTIGRRSLLLNARVLARGPGRSELILLAIEDVTERKREKDAFQRNEARMRALLDAMPDMMFRISRDGTYLDVHAAKRSDLLRTPGEILGSNIRQGSLPGEVADRCLAAIERALDTGTVQSIEYAVPVPEGVRHYEARVITSERDEVVAIVRDITERKRTEQKLRESEARVRSILETVAEGIVSIDDHGTVLSFNPAAEKIFGYTADEVIGRNVKMLMPPPYRELHDNFIVSYLSTGVQKVIGSRREVVGRRKNGTTFPMEVGVSEFHEGGGHRFTGIVRDIAERKQAEEQVRQRQAELAHVLRVSTMGELASGLAHELNQPLSAVANDVEACAAYVRSGDTTADSLLELLEHAASEALRAGEIVHHLREFVEKREPQLAVLDLRDLVRSVARLLEPELRQHRITLRLDPAPAALPICADGVQIEQVLVNIVQNAIDAILEAGGDQKEVGVRISQNEDGMAEIAVHDTGTGLSAGVAERIYEPFFTTKPHGLGMGIPISRSIIEAHHGRLSMAPRADGLSGTTVRLVLPLYTEGPPSESIA